MADDLLGDAEYEVYFKTRGGDRFICRARNMTALAWGRTMNDVSTASVTIALNDLDNDNCECVSQVNPWEHEMGIYRNGVEVWVGPVVNGSIDLANLVAKYEARDLSAWFDKRWVEVSDNDVEFEEADISEVFTWLIEHAYYKQPWNMTWSIPRTQVPIDRVYVGSDPSERWNGAFQSIGEELRALSNSGIDTTVVGRHYFGANDLSTPSVPSQILIDNHWATLPAIQIVGSAMATEVGVGGGNGGYYGWYDDQIWIERASTDDAGEKYGLLQSFFNAPELDDADTTSAPNAVTQQAYSLRESKKEPFVYIKGGSLSAKAPLPINSLIPGSVYAVKLLGTCRRIEDVYRLQAVNVSYSRDGEDVQLELVPMGADALR